MKARLSSNELARLVAFSFLLSFAAACSFNAIPGTGNNSSATPRTKSSDQNAQSEVKSPLPPPKGFVNDYANVIDPAHRLKLESLLRELKSKSYIEFAIVTVESTGDQSMDDYSLAVAKAWGIGPKNTSEGGGLLLLLAVKDKRWRLQVSRGLEKDLPDEVCKEFGERSEAFYRRGQYGEGIMKNVEAVINRLETLRGFTLNGEL